MQTLIFGIPWPNTPLVLAAWGPPRVKVRKGKESCTERQIGMLPSYFVLIKLSVIKCLLSYDNAIIIIYKMQVKFINQIKNFLIVSLACFIF